MIKLPSKGDTIVEVLIAIAIVSLVLSGAYASANRSLYGNRQAQERSEATKHVATQLERIKVKSMAELSPNTLFCLTTTLNVEVFSQAPLPSIDNDDYSTYPAACKEGSGVVYYLSIELSGTTYTGRARWDRAGGNGREQLEIVYRTYQ